MRREEKRGEIRWLRPEYQAPRFRGASAEPTELDLTRQEPPRLEPWPGSAADQIRALQNLLARTPCTVDEAFSRFAGARHDLLVRHLETLELMGEVRRGADGTYHAANAA